MHREHMKVECVISLKHTFHIFLFSLFFPLPLFPIVPFYFFVFYLFEHFQCGTPCMQFHDSLLASV